MRLPDEHRPRTTNPASPRVAIGPRILVPGLPQWSWDQRERSLFLFGTYASAVVVAIMTWGTLVGLGVLAFAFVTHVYSTVDAIRQNAFPGFGRFVPTVTASAGLGATCYVPALMLASAYAYPVALDERPREGYFVNCRAYRIAAPNPGEMVWIDSNQGVRSKLARVVAGSGQRIEWVQNELRVDGRLVEAQLFTETNAPGELKLTVPERHLLVVFSEPSRRGKPLPRGWEIVDQEEIRGQAWAQSYPIWDRSLLP